MDAANTDSQLVDCPKCQSPVPVELVTQLKPESPELDALMRGRLNRATCPGCAHEFLCDTPVLFRDDRARYVVYYLPRSTVSTVEQAITLTTQLYDTVFAELAVPLRPECRLALTRNHFIEKIALHQQGLDDRLVEYIKYQLYEHSEGLEYAKYELLFNFGDISEEQLNFMAFDRSNGQVAFMLGFRNEDYEDLEESLLTSPESATQLDDLFMGTFVQVDCLYDH